MSKGNVSMSLILQSVLFIGVVYCCLVLFMFFRQESFLFFPTVSSHSNQNYPGVVDYALANSEVQLKGWLLNPQYSRDKILIYYGGNAEDIFNNIEEFQGVQCASLFVSYRGYGPSSGRPSEQGFFKDALVVLDDIVEKYAPAQIYLMGRSLGSGVACYVASKREVDGVVLITPYDSIEQVAKRHYPWLPISFLLKHRFSSDRYIGQISSPILVIYGEQDTVVPPQHTENLIRYGGENVKVVSITKADHQNIDLYQEYWQELLEFIQ